MAVALPAAGLLAAKWAGTSEVASGETGDTRRLAAIGVSVLEAEEQTSYEMKRVFIDVDLAKTELTTPFDGIVTRRMVDEGQVLSAGAPVLELQEDAVPEIRVGVGGTLARTLRAGEGYQPTVNDEAIGARLRAVLPLRSARSRSVDALFEP